jgi:hypothetical protein
MRQYKVEKDFSIDGYRCVIIGGNLGHRCGYIGLPKSHPLYGKNYDYISSEMNIQVHGGWTYFGNGHGTYPVESNLWWIGFDCGHYGDGKDFELIKELNSEEEYLYILQMEKMHSTSEWETVRTQEYVGQELINAVGQLIDCGRTEKAPCGEESCEGCNDYPCDTHFNTHLF